MHLKLHRRLTHLLWFMLLLENTILFFILKRDLQRGGGSETLQVGQELFIWQE